MSHLTQNMGFPNSDKSINRIWTSRWSRKKSMDSLNSMKFISRIWLDQWFPKISKDSPSSEIFNRKKWMHRWSRKRRSKDFPNSETYSKKKWMHRWFQTKNTVYQTSEKWKIRWTIVSSPSKTDSLSLKRPNLKNSTSTLLINSTTPSFPRRSISENDDNIGLRL